ncbi:MAG: Ldh family oxidoreductase [Spirochaetaceae bacterium]
MEKIEINHLITFYTEQLVELGVPFDRANRMATAQVEVHGFGVDTHGLPPLNCTIRDIKKSPENIVLPKIINEFGALLTADCSKTPNVEPILWGMDRAAYLAKDHGLGFVSLINGGWVGTMGYHLSHWAKKGYLMMAWNQTSHIAFVNMFGGKEPKLNTSPMAFSFPLNREKTGLKPLVADFSTSTISMGKTNQMSTNGVKAIGNIYQDKEGYPSNNPDEARNGGTILPFGGADYGFRGTSLALLIEAMTAAAGSKPINKEKVGGQNTHVFALNIDALGNMDEYNMLIEDLMAWVLDSTPVPGVSEVRYPGQRGWKSLEEARSKGVKINDNDLNELIKMGYDT